MGHIEDIVVNKDQQGKKLGLRIIEALDFIAEKVGCYKVGTSNSRCFDMQLELYCLVWDTALTSIYTDDSRLLRDERRLLCEVWLQARGTGDGTLLREKMTTGTEPGKGKADSSNPWGVAWEFQWKGKLSLDIRRYDH